MVHGLTFSLAYGPRVMAETHNLAYALQVDDVFMIRIEIEGMRGGHMERRECDVARLRTKAGGRTTVHDWLLADQNGDGHGDAEEVPCVSACVWICVQTCARHALRVRELLPTGP